MSNQVAGHKTNPSRDPLDWYPTDPGWTHALMHNCMFSGDIHEPCAGDGCMADVISGYGHRVISSDLSPRRAGILQRDALALGPVANIVTNPPYNLLKDLIPYWLDTTSHKLAVLVRINFLEAQSRIPWLTGKNTPELVLAVAGRMKVLGKVSQFPHAWVVWDRSATCASTELRIVRPLS